jgi:hypothetical protein
VKYNAAKLIEMGFKAAVIEDYQWSEKDLQLLRENLIALARKKIINHTSDIWYFLSHHIFNGKIAPKNIKQKTKDIGQILFNLPDVKVEKKEENE